MTDGSLPLPCDGGGKQRHVGESLGRFRVQMTRHLVAGTHL